MQSLLQEILAAPRVEAAAIISRDGFCLQNPKERLKSPETIGAMAAAAFAAAETALHVLRKGPLQRLILQSAKDAVVAYGLDDHHVLIAIFLNDGDANADQHIRPMVAQMTALLSEE